MAGGRERIGHAENDTSVGSPFDTPTTAPSQPRGARLPGSGPGRDTPARRRACDGAAARAEHVGRSADCEKAARFAG
ncbi:hypothetical protein AQ802_11955 [Burkholderia pseudomallei]|nr:hypothetical protein D512_06735 [Burkholderia pseudomallei MSHR1043]EQA90173.1 hypothetical protein M218_05780 [Burkholderia pseudomallei MSHR338]KIX58816.1 hypothetical protein SZ29_10075 [Burkholderia pseudomallei]OAB13720.1 hypothetical protein AQ846_17535 [Burkholderia pseudomallei]OAB20303.1 hypothetical protein AQ853_08835 [Burkholderia pseudomallei]